MEKGFVQREKEERSEKNESAESSSRLFLACTCNISNMEKRKRDRGKKGRKKKQNPRDCLLQVIIKKFCPNQKSKNSRNHVMTIEKYFFLHAEYPRLGLFSILFYSISLVVPYFYSFIFLFFSKLLIKCLTVNMYARQDYIHTSKS